MITAEQKRQDYIDDLIATGIARGEAKDRRDGLIAIATTALGLGMFPAQIAAITGLSIDEVEELQRPITSST